MSCAEKCDCSDKGSKSSEITFDRLAALKVMMEGDLVQQTDNAKISRLPSPIVIDRDNWIALQFAGWAIEFHTDGKWLVTDTSGG